MAALSIERLRWDDVVIYHNLTALPPDPISTGSDAGSILTMSGMTGTTVILRHPLATHLTRHAQCRFWNGSARSVLGYVRASRARRRYHHPNQQLQGRPHRQRLIGSRPSRGGTNRHAGAVRRYPFIGVDRRQSAHGQNDAFGPTLALLAIVAAISMLRHRWINQRLVLDVLGREFVDGGHRMQLLQRRHCGGR